MELLCYLFILISALLGTPLFVIMALIALSAFSFAEIESSAVIIEVYRLASAPTLLTIPLFTFAGHMMADSQTPTRLLRFAQAALGAIPGGIAIVGLVVCAFFTAFTGASGVTIIALGGLLFPILRKEGYSEKFSLGLITTSGSLGLLFPPSLPIILYGLVAKQDIDSLFKAGIIPGSLLVIILSFWSIKNYRANTTSQDKKKFDFKEVKAAFLAAYLELLLPVLILVGIYGGFTTASEAASLTALYVFIMEFFIYKDLKLKEDFSRIVKDSMSLVGSILLILVCALGVTNYIVDEEIPVRLFEFMKLYITNKYLFLIFLNIFLLVVGCMMDIFSAIIVVVPLIIPIANEFGVHPIHLAIIFLTNLEIGYITPPVGINLFISSFKFKKPITELYRASLPFFLLLLIALMLITYIPSLSLFLVE